MPRRPPLRPPLTSFSSSGTIETHTTVVPDSSNLAHIRSFHTTPHPSAELAPNVVPGPPSTLSPVAVRKHDLSTKADPPPRFKGDRIGLGALAYSDDHTLGPEQQEVLRAAINGQSFFLTGSAGEICLFPRHSGHAQLTRHTVSGTGKTFLLRKIVDALQARDKVIALTSSTGISALHINGKTVHSWAGIGAARGSLPFLLDKVEKNRNAKAAWKTAHVLIIDESSCWYVHVLLVRIG